MCDNVCNVAPCGFDGGDCSESGSGAPIGAIIAGIAFGIVACMFACYWKVQPECEAERDVESHAYPQALLDQQRRQSLQIAPISAVVVVPLQQRTNWAGVAPNQQATHLQPDDNSYVQTDDL